MKANYQDKVWHGIKVNRGSFLTSRDKLAEELKLSVQNIRTAISHLKSTGELTIKPTNKNRIVSVCNYESYQVKKDATNQQTNQQLTINQPTTNQQLTTTNKEKNIKNDKKEDKQIVSERKPEKNETDEKTKDMVVIPFIKFWYLYDMKKAMADCKDYWDGNKKLKTKKYITNSDRKLCIKNLPAYVKNTHKNGTYPSRKDPKTYLYNSSWNDEIIYGNESAEDKSDREVVERMRKQGTLK
jgi:hypothetical protein